MLRATLLGGKEACGGSPGVPVGPEGALAQQAVQPCLVRVARHLVVVQVVTTRVLVVEEAAGEKCLKRLCIKMNPYLMAGFPSAKNFTVLIHKGTLNCGTKISTF